MDIIVICFMVYCVLMSFKVIFMLRSLLDCQSIIGKGLDSISEQITRIPWEIEKNNDY